MTQATTTTKPGETGANDQGNAPDAPATEKGTTFKCGGCGVDWSHKVKNTSGLCQPCVEIKRGIQSFINKGTVSLPEMKKRLEKLIPMLTVKPATKS